MRHKRFGRKIKRKIKFRLLRMATKRRKIARKTPIPNGQQVIGAIAIHRFVRAPTRFSIAGLETAEFAIARPVTVIRSTNRHSSFRKQVSEKMNSFQRPLILDLDFTLLHLEKVPDAIEVPGRTRSAWIAPQTVAALHFLQDKFEIILATARSWDGTRWVADGLRERDVEIGGLVIEDGACWGKTGDLTAFEPSFDAPQLRDLLASKAQNWPHFEWQLDFEKCVVARCENGETAARLLQIFEQQAELEPWNPRFFRDGRKVYILPRGADKWSALQKLLGARAKPAAGVGDGANDVVWLSQIEFPATFFDANRAAIEAVRARNGTIGGTGGHQAIADLLLRIGEDQPETSHLKNQI